MASEWLQVKMKLKRKFSNKIKFGIKNINIEPEKNVVKMSVQSETQQIYI